MSVLHLCNTFFEQELSGEKLGDLTTQLRSHPAIFQLQFLPLLYGEKNDLILVSDLPENPDPRLRSIETTNLKGTIEHWGPSQTIQRWAKRRSLDYPLQDWEMIRTVNSKIFSFTQAPKLPFASLLHTPEEVRLWAEKTKGRKVLKTPFGTSGRGHFHFEKGSLDRFLQKELSPKLSLIGEPWVERIFDFSTQWRLGEAIQYLGATAFKNKENGAYLGTFVGISFQSFEWALEEHLEIAKELLKKIWEMGYRGNVGIDAFIYRWEGKELVHPIVEINGRKTMSWAALQIQAKHFPGEKIFVHFEKGTNGLLPQKIERGDKTILFPLNLFISKVD